VTAYFVDSNAGAGLNDGTSKTDAFLTLAQAAAVWTAADIVHVSSAHAETPGTVTYTLPTSPGLEIWSEDWASGDVPLKGAAISVGAVAGGDIIISSGFGYFYGFVLTAGTTGASAGVSIANGNAVSGIVLEESTLAIPSNTSSHVGLGPNDENHAKLIKLINPVFIFGSTESSILLNNAVIDIKGATLAGAAVPTNLFSSTAARCPRACVGQSDLSGLAWTNLVSIPATDVGYCLFQECKFPSGFAISTGTFVGPGGLRIIVEHCDSGDVHYGYIEECWEGTITNQVSVFADASDGTHDFAYLMAGNANTSFSNPLMSPQLVTMNNTVASARQVRVEVVNDGTTFQDDELWVETAAKITSGVPLGTWNRDDRVANFLTATPANQDTSTVDWTGTSGFDIVVKQKLVTGSFTPAEVGPVTSRVFLGVDGSVYISPNAVLEAA
jgi:hypothetical protein